MNANDPLGEVLRDGDTIGLRYRWSPSTTWWTA